MVHVQLASELVHVQLLAGAQVQVQACWRKRHARGFRSEARPARGGTELGVMGSSCLLPRPPYWPRKPSIRKSATRSSEAAELEAAQDRGDGHATSLGTEKLPEVELCQSAYLRPRMSSCHR